MTLALEILEARKHAGLFGSTLDSLTPFGRAEKLRQRRGAPTPIPASAIAAKAKSLDTTKQIQDLTQKLQDPSFKPLPIPGSQAERDAVHQNTMTTLKNVEASRVRPRLPLPIGPAMKAACTNHPALDVMRSRAA